MAKSNKAESKKGGVTNRGTLYAHTSKYAIEAIDFLVVTMRNEKTQMSVRVSAANKIIDKCLPDLKAAEISGIEGGDIIVKIIAEEPKKAAEDE